LKIWPEFLEIPSYPRPLSPLVVTSAPGMLSFFAIFRYDPDMIWLINFSYENVNSAGAIILIAPATPLAPSRPWAGNRL
jgi:hypothetical protein